MINNDMLDQRSPMGNLWHGVQAIAQRDKKKKTKNNLYHIYCNAPALLSTIPMARDKGQSGCQNGKRSEDDPKDASKGHKRSNARASLNSHLWGRLRGQVRPECGKLLGFWNQRKLISKDIHSICNDLNSKWVEFLDRGGFMLYEDPSRYRFS